jgi:hypothetical protein
MFTENKYKKWYDMIIDNAKNRDLNGYKERHHIIPKCMGGSNKETNLVDLTAREHFICHWLLTKCIEDTFYRKKMLNALGKFVQKNSKQKRNLTSRQYEIVRSAISEANKNRAYTDEMREKISQANIGKIPWNKGKTGLQVYSEEAKEKLKSMYSNKSLEERHGSEKAKLVKEKISKAKEGKPSGMLGKTHSLETREKMSKNMKGKRGPQQRIESCPSCNKENVTARHIKFCKEKVDYK